MFHAFDNTIKDKAQRDQTDFKNQNPDHSMIYLMSDNQIHSLYQSNLFLSSFDVVQAVESKNVYSQQLLPANRQLIIRLEYVICTLTKPGIVLSPVEQFHVLY